MTPSEFKPSQLRDLYGVLGTLSEEEQLALARLYAGEGTKRLVQRFQRSCELVAKYPMNLEPFHGRTARGEAETLGLPKAVDEIERTEDIAAHLVGDELHRVANDATLNFGYLDREIFALRHTAADGWRAPARRIDLLLASEDGFPIVGELKIGSDKPTFFALIQALMYATELSSRLQRERLEGNYKRLLEHGPLLAADGPFLDIYLIAFQPPERGLFRDDAFAASAEICSKLIAEPAINSVIRRFAYLEVVPDHGGLTFESRPFG